MTLKTPSPYATTTAGVSNTGGAAAPARKLPVALIVIGLGCGLVAVIGVIGIAGVIVFLYRGSRSTAPPVSPASTVSSAPPVSPTPHPGKMVHIPTETFWMGSLAGVGDKDEHPRHQVHVQVFYMDVTEVTVAHTACVAAGSCPTAPTTVDWPGISASTRTLGSRFCNGHRADRADHPEKLRHLGQVAGLLPEDPRAAAY